MLIYGQINSVEKITLEDNSILYRCEIIDKAKPSSQRTSGRFLKYIPADKLSSLADKVEDLEDLNITAVPKEASGSSGNITLKGGIFLKGHVEPNKLASVSAKS